MSDRSGDKPRCVFRDLVHLGLAAFVLCISAMAQDPNEMVKQMVTREDAAAQHKQHFFYVATERSERTGGHTWKERVAETTSGKVRFLLAVDGQALSPEQDAGERRRLAAILADPTTFVRTEREKKSDEEKAKALLTLLSKAFVLQNLRREGDLVLIDFEPNPDYQAQSMEEKVLHGMSGTLSMDAKALRLHEIKGELRKDVSVGFGLETIHAGSGFATARDMVVPGEWKTAMVDTNISGRAILFKSLGKNEHVTRRSFRLLPFDLSLAQAVEMVERADDSL